MIKISVSQASKIIGVSRREMQLDIYNGKIQTHEGLVTMDSLQRAYPLLDLNQDSSKIIKRADNIKKAAVKNKNKENILRSDRDIFYKEKIIELQKIIKEKNRTIQELIKQINHKTQDPIPNQHK